MKELTIKELSELISLPAGTVRSWTLKPVQGQPYSSSNINYDALRAGIAKYYPDFEKQFGFAIEDLVLTKSERTTKEYVDVHDLVIGDTIIFHNYSLQTKLTLASVVEIDNIMVFIFKSDKQFKAYDEVQLQAANFKIEKVEA